MHLQKSSRERERSGSERGPKEGSMVVDFTCSRERFSVK